MNGNGGGDGGGDGTPDLVASTGVNDSSSPWNGLLSTALESGVSIGQSALQRALNLQTPVNPATGGSGAPPAATAAAPAIQAARGGSPSMPVLLALFLGVFLLLFFFMRGR